MLDALLDLDEGLAQKLGVLQRVVFRTRVVLVPDGHDDAALSGQPRDGKNVVGVPDWLGCVAEDGRGPLMRQQIRDNARITHAHRLQPGIICFGKR